MIENYKGWDITLNWDDKDPLDLSSRRNITYNRNEKWKGVNLNGFSIYGSSLKEIRHIIDYPALHNQIFK